MIVVLQNHLNIELFNTNKNIIEHTIYGFYSTKTVLYHPATTQFLSVKSFMQNSPHHCLSWRQRPFDTNLGIAPKKDSEYQRLKLG